MLTPPCPSRLRNRPQHRRRAGRFILATNVLDAEVLSPIQALEEYKAQQGTERGFRFLKDPLFFASYQMSITLAGRVN
jgi:transposase